MKIEMGESLMRSWLRHIQYCQLAELNWKPSDTWPIRDQQKLMDAANSYFKSKIGTDIFGGTKSSSQLLCQSEIDVLGIKFGSKGMIEKAFAVDIAFHEAGLNYRGNSDTLTRVLKKLVRSAMVMQSYFPETPVNLVFACPVVGPSTSEALIGGFSLLTNFFNDNCKNIECSLIINESFKSEILEPTLLISSEVADTSELFLRGFKLLNIFDKTETEINGKNSKVSETSDFKKDTLKIDLVPQNANEFKIQLLKSKAATIEIIYSDGRVEQRIWNASNMTENSNVIGNLRSRPEFRIGKWQENGIASIRVKAA